MFKWIKNIFSSSSAVENVLNKENGLITQVGSWIGGMSYTEEERAEFIKGAQDGVVEFVKSTLSESTSRSRTRRTVAILWISIELLIVMLTCVAVIFNPEIAEFYWSVATSELMFYGTMSVIAFFFGPYMIGSHFRRQENKKSASS